MAPILMTIVNHLSIKNLLVRRTTYTENLSRPQPVSVASGDRTSGDVDDCAQHYTINLTDNIIPYNLVYNITP